MENQRRRSAGEQAAGENQLAATLAIAEPDLSSSSAEHISQLQPPKPSSSKKTTKSRLAQPFKALREVSRTASLKLRRSSKNLEEDMSAPETSSAGSTLEKPKAKKGKDKKKKNSVDDVEVEQIVLADSSADDAKKKGKKKGSSLVRKISSKYRGGKDKSPILGDQSMTSAGDTTSEDNQSLASSLHSAGGQTPDQSPAHPVTASFTEEVASAPQDSLLPSPTPPPHKQPKILAGELSQVPPADSVIFTSPSRIVAMETTVNKIEENTEQTESATMSLQDELQAVEDVEKTEAKHQEGTSEKITSSSEKTESSSEKTESSPEKKESSPEKTESSPEKIKNSPEKKESSPEKIKSSPEKKESSPEKTESSPEIAHTSNQKESETTSETEGMEPKEQEQQPSTSGTSEAREIVFPSGLVSTKVDTSENTAQNGEKREHLYKILVIGELGTGKTSIIKRYVHQFFSQHYRATIGVDFALKVLNWDQNTVIRLQLWDIAGQERFGNMTRVYYKEAVGAFIVFDVTRTSTFDAVLKWKSDLDSKVQLPDGSAIPCVLLANKCDQQKEGVVNTPAKMDEYCKEHGFSGWYETSAKENINIDEAARYLVTKILQNDKLANHAVSKDNDGFALGGTGNDDRSSQKSCAC